jgi:hypothetical protein
LESSKQRLKKEEGTKEKIARGEISLDFYNLRPTLDKEQVFIMKTKPSLIIGMPRINIKGSE